MITNRAIWLVLSAVRISLSLPKGNGNAFMSRRVSPYLRCHFSFFSRDVGHYLKKKKMLFTSLSWSVLGKTLPDVLSTARGRRRRTSRLANNIFLRFQHCLQNCCWCLLFIIYLPKSFSKQRYQRDKKRAECIVEFYKQARIFKNTREAPRSTPRTSRVFLKILKCL